MTKNGSPLWLLIAFGAVACGGGMYLWHRQGPCFGLGKGQGKVSTSAAFVSAGMFLALTGVEVVRNVR